MNKSTPTLSPKSKINEKCLIKLINLLDLENKERSLAVSTKKSYIGSVKKLSSIGFSCEELKSKPAEVIAAIYKMKYSVGRYK